MKEDWLCAKEICGKIDNASEEFKNTYDVRAVDSFDYDMVMGEIANAMKLVTVE